MEMVKPNLEEEDAYYLFGIWIIFIKKSQCKVLAYQWQEQDGETRRDAKRKVLRLYT